MQLTTLQLRVLFALWAQIMQSEQEKLIALDSIVGDGDLGLTMSDGFSAAYTEVKNSPETDVGNFFYQAGKRMSTAVPSTMGTLMASGLMHVGKAFKGKQQMATHEFAALFRAFFDGVQARGKANIGEKTFLDGLAPALQLLENPPNTMDWRQLAQQAYYQSQQGVQATTTMLALHGRAATRGENSRALLDPGAYVAQLLLQGYTEFAQTILPQITVADTASH